MTEMRFLFCSYSTQPEYVLHRKQCHLKKCWSYLALGNLILLVSVHHWDRLHPDLLHLVTL